MGGTPGVGLRWRARSTAVDLRSGGDAAALCGVPEVRVVSAIPDNAPAQTDDDEALAGALVRLGMKKPDAVRRIAWARRAVAEAGEIMSDEGVLRRALAG